MEGHGVRILMLTQWFDPEPAIKGLEFARQLAARGHEVEVLTGFPNYPAGRLYPGYRLRPWQRESRDGVSILRVPLYPNHDRSTVRRILNYASFALSAATLGAALARRPDVIYVYHPPATIGIAALALRWRFGAPVVYDVQDLWPDSVAVTGMLRRPSALRWLGRLCDGVYRRVERIVVVTPGFRSALITRGVPAEKIELIYNWAPGEEAASAKTLDGVFTVVYAGTMGLAQGLDTVLDAAVLCPEARFLLVGDGVEAQRLRERASELRLANVEFRGWQTPEAMREIYAGAGALLVHLKDDPLFAITIPSKTQAYLAAGRPIVLGGRGDAAELVARSGAGLVVRPGDARAMAGAVRRLSAMPEAERTRMGCAGREFYRRNLAMGRAVSRFNAVFRGVRRRSYSGKRVLDLLVASAALIAALPLMAAIAFAIRCCLGSPVFFRQKRAGLHGALFEICKFRTMREGHGPDAVRATRLGNFLRQTSLDELPELIHVLRGEMSLVGPRPLLPEYLPRYTRVQSHRHDVLPGITGMAQVMGRQDLRFSRRIQWDLWYVRHNSFAVDLGILWRTISRVAFGSGVRLNQDVREVDDLAPLGSAS